MARKFHYEGTSIKGFFNAGSNYTFNPVLWNAQKTASELMKIVSQRFESVCEDGQAHGWCNHQRCELCRVNGAKELAFKDLAKKMVAEATTIKVVNNYHIHDCHNVVIYNEPCARDRGVKRYEQK